MSIIRWGTDGSNVYIIGSGGWECVGCDGPGHYQRWDDEETMTVSPEKLELFLAHLKWHRDKGDCVPDYVEARLRKANAEGY